MGLVSFRKLKEKKISQIRRRPTVNHHWLWRLVNEKQSNTSQHSKNYIYNVWDFLIGLVNVNNVYDYFMNEKKFKPKKFIQKHRFSSEFQIKLFLIEVDNWIDCIFSFCEESVGRHPFSCQQIQSISFFFIVASPSFIFFGFFLLTYFFVDCLFRLKTILPLCSHVKQ